MACIHCTPTGIEFHSNLPSTFVRNSLANPVISCDLLHFPIVPKNCITYVTVHVCIYFLSSCYSEIYHAKRWHSDFPSPMTVTSIGHVYVNDSTFRLL